MIIIVLKIQCYNLLLKRPFYCLIIKIPKQYLFHVRALLKLEDMKSSSKLCSALAKHGILKKKVNKNRSTSYIIEKESMAYNQMLKKIQRKKEVVSRKNDVLSNRKNKRNVNVGKDSSLVNAVNSKLAISNKDSRKINYGINSNISSEDDDVSITDY